MIFLEEYQFKLKEFSNKASDSDGDSERQTVSQQDSQLLEEEKRHDNQFEEKELVLMEQNGAIVLNGRDNENSSQLIKESTYKDREIELEDDEEEISDDSSIISEDANSEGTMSAFSDNMMQYKGKLNENELTKLKQKEELQYKTPHLEDGEKMKVDMDYYKSPGRYNDQRNTLISGNKNDNFIDTMVIPNFQDNNNSDIGDQEITNKDTIRKNSFNETETDMDLNYEEADIKEYESNFGGEENYIREGDI